MKINFELTEEDYLHFNLFHLRNSEIVKKLIQKNRILTSLSLIVIGLILSFIIFLGAGSFDIVLFIIFLVVSILMYLFYPQYAIKTAIKRLKKNISDDARKKMFTHYEFEFSNEGIVEKTPYNETKMNWNAIYSFKEDSDYFYLYPDPTRAYIIPKKECENQNELKNLIKKLMQ